MAPRKLFKIGEVMKYSKEMGLGPRNKITGKPMGFSRQTIHNYTMMGLIEEAERTDSGHRLYPEGVFERIQKIEMLKRHRTLREVMDLVKKEEKSGKDAK